MTDTQTADQERRQVSQLRYVAISFGLQIPEYYMMPRQDMIKLLRDAIAGAQSRIPRA